MARHLRWQLPIALLLSWWSAFSQSVQIPSAAPTGEPQTRTIRGRVLDTKGAPVPNAAVIIKDLKTLQVRSFIADKDGAYHFYGLSSEVAFQLRAQANGLTSKQKTVSVFDSHRVVKLDLKLKKKARRKH